MFEDKSIAVLIPCMNEALTISQVIKGFQTSLPKAAIYIYDNNSTDDTAKVAEKAGAILRTEKRPGKGKVVRRMFSEIDAYMFMAMAFVLVLVISHYFLGEALNMRIAIDSVLIIAGIMVCATA